MLVLHLLSPGFKVVLVLRYPLSFAFACLNPVRPAVETYAIDIAHHHRAVVVVVNYGHVDVRHGAVVHKFSSAPFTTPETDTRIAEAIINPAIKADVRTPVSGVPSVNASAKSPISWSPQQTRLR